MKKIRIKRTRNLREILEENKKLKEDNRKLRKKLTESAICDVFTDLVLDLVLDLYG